MRQLIPCVPYFLSIKHKLNYQCNSYFSLCLFSIVGFGVSLEFSLICYKFWFDTKFITGLYFGIKNLKDDDYT